MRKICAWCQLLLVKGFGPASHGLCAECEARHFPEEAV